ncbi:flagellar biosynthetic protein FlhB [Hydrogenispora ethanolica]|jgi:flagellar biosynthetic protein FlhB|uniref:Flagellar biosynthetic protein FlhB n=1 Tax=Hydrogenispora ethanolica TaxID=1082276 RepID=A0A4R1RL26_HYDET|nr:flagellar biosynthesis protein FlhB [Hydrogenispora ethanolica]TCL66560.1 flagellar biosynthetic protein FlhB [Hydrogenispora ethanolica]
MKFSQLRSYCKDNRLPERHPAAAFRPFDLQFFAASDPDRTEEATPKRKSEARQKGQVSKSAELNSVVVLLAAFIFINTLGSWIYSELANYMKVCLAPAALSKNLSQTNAQQLFLEHLVFFLKVFLPLGLGAMVVGILVNFLQVGPMFTIEALKPKFSRINPISGMQRLLGIQGLVELAKSVIKLLIISYFAYSTIRDHLFSLLDVVAQSPLDTAVLIWTIIYQVALKICVFLLILAIFDYLYQRWEFNKSLRMTKKEVKDEYKQLEGNPQIKNKIRQRQRQIAARRMMQDVPKADVIITNPTHLAIAIRYDAAEMAAPVVVAKGEGFIAQKIKEIAKAHDVSVVENKPLAQTLYKTVEIGEAIPANLYKAVAEVLAFVYRLKRRFA